MLESFVSTQKMGVQKALQKKFRQFISYKKDFVELLMATLQASLMRHMSLQSVVKHMFEMLSTLSEPFWSRLLLCLRTLQMGIDGSAKMPYDPC